MTATHADASAPIVTIDGAQPPACFAAHIQRCHERYAAANGCPACRSALYVDHGPTCPKGLGKAVTT